MSLREVIAALHHWRARVRGQAQRARDIWHLREAARMLIEDKPDKTKAVEAVNAIAAQRLAAMDADARVLFNALPAVTNDGVAADPGERLHWLMSVNDPGRFPYTQGPDAPGAAAEARAEPSMLRNADDMQTLATALAEGWAGLAVAPETVDAIELRALQFAIAFDEHRDAVHRALGCAARRLWAVSLRDVFGVRGEGLKLRLISAAVPRLPDRGQDVDAHATDRAEAALLAALARHVSSPTAE